MTQPSSYGVGVTCTVGIGPERGGRARNEDNYLVGQAGQVRTRVGGSEHRAEAEGHAALVVAVADGMGGHEDGEVASTTTVQAIAELYGLVPDDDREGALRTFLLNTHRKLRPKVAVDGVVKMGTTLTVVWVVDGVACWAHVGDSRLYLLRDRALTQVTRDHTRAEFARRDGRTLPLHPHNLSQNFLYGSRGLGLDDSIRIDRGVDTGTFPLLPGDRLLLCSDGLHGFVPPPLMTALLPTGDAQDATHALVGAALTAESDDNITAVVVDVPR